MNESPHQLKKQVCEAFAAVPHPGDERLRNSNEGDEPFLVERDFRGKHDWRLLTAEFIDNSPDGLASALNFFSHAAFRFYLPAYLLADIEGKLERTDPVFHLTHGLERASADKPINPQRYGDETWSAYARERFANFTREEAAAVVAYLKFKRQMDEFTCQEIDDALQNYWHQKAGESSARTNE